MKRILLLEMCFLFLATTFQSDRQTGWIQQTIPRPDLAVQDLQFLDSLNGFVLKSRYNPDTSIIFKTTDGGNNWNTTLFENMYSTSLFFADNNTGYFAGRTTPNGVIQKTTNGGQNWFFISSITYSSVLRDIVFLNKDTGYVCSDDLTSGGLWRTTNGGVSWQKQLNETYRPNRMFFVNVNTGWFVTENTYNLYKTTNCGVNWFVQTTFQYSPIDVFFNSIDTGWILGGAGNGILHTINGGNNWDTVINPNTIYIGATFFFPNNKIGFVGNRPYNILATKDGYNWGYQYSPIYTSYNVSFVDSLVGWAGCGGLVHTTDGGGEIISEIIYQNEPLPCDFSIEQNYPNPFNQSSIINYKCSMKSDVLLKVYDIRGREVATLVNEIKEAGSYEATFNAGNLTSGIYFYRLQITEPTEQAVRFSDTKRMILIK